MIDEIAQTLNEAWNQTGYGVVIAFAPRRHQLGASVAATSLLESRDGLTDVFSQAAHSDLARGDDAAAAASGVDALMHRLGDVQRRLTPGEQPSWRPSRAMLLVMVAGVALAGLALLWFALRVLRAANVFDHSYRLPASTTPAGLRFGGRRCGGLLAKRFPPALETEHAKERDFDREIFLDVAAQVIPQFLEPPNPFQNLAGR